MDLFGLNWQLQESESYGTFENDGGERDPIPNTIMVSTDNGEFLQTLSKCLFLHQKCSFSGGFTYIVKKSFSINIAFARLIRTDGLRMTLNCLFFRF